MEYARLYDKNILIQYARLYDKNILIHGPIIDTNKISNSYNKQDDRYYLQYELFTYEGLTEKWGLEKGNNLIVACAMADIPKEISIYHNIWKVNVKFNSDGEIAILPEINFTVKFNSEKQKIENYDTSCVVTSFDLEKAEWFPVEEFRWMNRDGMVKEITNTYFIKYYWENKNLYKMGSNIYYRNGISQHYEDSEKIIDQDEYGTVLKKEYRQTGLIYERIPNTNKILLRKSMQNQSPINLAKVD